MGCSYRLRSRSDVVRAGVQKFMLPRPRFESGHQRHRALWERYRPGWGHSVRRGPCGCFVYGRRSDGQRTGRRSGGRCAPLGRREGRLLFRPGFAGKDDEDDEAQEERHGQGKALLATRTYPRGCVALRLPGGQQPGTPYRRGVYNSRQRPASTSVRRGARNIRNNDPANNRVRCQDVGLEFLRVERTLWIENRTGTARCRGSPSLRTAFSRSP